MEKVQNTQLLLVSAPPQGHCDCLEQKQVTDYMPFLTEAGISFHRHGPWESIFTKGTVSRDGYGIYLEKIYISVGTFYLVTQCCGSASLWCGYGSWFLFDTDANPGPTFRLMRIRIPLIVRIRIRPKWYGTYPDTDPGSQNDADQDPQHWCTLIVIYFVFTLHRMILSGVLISFGCRKAGGVYKFTGSFVNAFFKRERRQSGFLTAPLKWFNAGRIMCTLRSISSQRNSKKSVKYRTKIIQN